MIKLINTKGMNKTDWLKERQKGIGCSDVSSILGLNNYKSSLELFYEKVEGTSDVIMNPAMFMGNYLEDKIADLYQYWEVDMQKTMENFTANKKINKIQRVNSILTNKKYPFLLGNLDRKQIKPVPAVIEIKTASGFTLNSWQHGVPPMYIIQCQAYMMITEYVEANLCILKDGRYLEVYNIKENKQIQSNIAEACESFWERVQGARKFKAEGKPFESYEPDPDGTDAYEQFLKKKFQSKPIAVDGTMAQLEVAKFYVQCQERLKTVKDEMQQHRNTLISDMREIESLNFGVAGYVSWKPREDGARVFNVKLKTNLNK